MSQEGQEDIPKIVDFSSKQQISAEVVIKNEVQVEDQIITELQRLNLNDLLNVQLNGTDTLKKNFECIIDAISSNFSFIKSIRTDFQAESQESTYFRNKITENFNQINKINQSAYEAREEQVVTNSTLQESVKQMKTQMEANQEAHANQIKELQAQVTHLKDNNANKDAMNNMIKQIDELKEQLQKENAKNDDQQSEIDSLKKQLDQFLNMAMSGGEEQMGPVQMKLQSFQIQLEELQKKLASLVHQPEFQVLKQDVHEQKSQINELKNLPPKVQYIENKIAETHGMPSDSANLDEMRSQLNAKVNLNDFNKKIGEIESKLTSGSKQTPQKSQGGGISQSDLVILDRIPYLEELIKTLNQQMEETTQQFDQYKEQQQNTIQEIKTDKMDKKDFSSYDDLPQKQVNKETHNQISYLKENMNRMNNKAANDEMQMALFEERIKKLNELLEAQQKTINGLNLDNSAQASDELKKATDNLMEMINGMVGKIEKKASKTDITSSEEGKILILGLLQKLDKCIEALIKKMADKNDTKKALLFLEKRINDLYQLSFDKKSSNDDDPLLAKRPLFWSCASCDIDVDKYRGKLGEYKNWAVFPPKETTPDRMGRFGIGYYNMMRNRKLGLQNERDKLAQLQEYNFRNLMESRDIDDMNVKGVEDNESQKGNMSKSSITKAKQ